MNKKDGKKLAIVVSIVWWILYFLIVLFNYWNKLARLNRGDLIMLIVITAVFVLANVLMIVDVIKTNYFQEKGWKNDLPLEDTDSNTGKADTIFMGDEIRLTDPNEGPINKSRNACS